MKNTLLVLFFSLIVNFVISQKENEINLFNEQNISLVNSYQEIISTYRNLLVESDPNYFLFKKEISLREIYLRHKEIALYLFELGRTNFYKGNLKQAELFFYGSLYIHFQSKEMFQASRVFNHLGSIFGEQGRYELGLHSYLHAIKSLETLDIEKDIYISSIYNNIGVLFKEINNYKKSIQYYNAALKIKFELNDSVSIAGILTNIGNVYADMKLYQKSLSYHKKAFEIYKKLDMVSGVAISYNNIGSVYISLEMYDLAYEYLTKAYQVNQEFENPKSIVLNILNIAKVYHRQGKYQDAKTWASRGMELSQTMGKEGLDIDIYKFLVEIYESTGEYSEAFKYLKNYIAMKDSILGIENTNMINELEIQYQTQIKEAQIEKQKLQILEQEFKISRRNSVIIITVSFLLFILSLLAYAYIRLKMKQQYKLNTLLLEAEKNRTHAIIEAVEEERKRIARDLHDGLGQNIATLKLRMFRISDYLKYQKIHLPENEIQHAVESLDEIYKETRNLSHQMMPKTLLFLGLADACRDLIEKVNSYTNIHFQFDHNLNQRFEQATEIGLYRIFQELINNIVKHSGADKVEISLLKTTEQLILIVEDNGHGFDKNSSSKGIGLLNIESRAKIMSGQFDISSIPNEGTTAIVRISLA